MPKNPDRKSSNPIGKAALSILKIITKALVLELADRIIQLIRDFMGF